jgi:hypothetical protein
VTRLLRPHEVAERLSVSLAMACREIKHAMFHVRIGQGRGVLRVSEQELARYIFRQGHSPKPHPVCVPQALAPLIEVLQEASLGEGTPGVYFLLRQDEVVYVGQSLSVLTRIETHRRQGVKVFDRAVYLTMPEEVLDEAEGAFIKLLQPEYNGAGPVVADHLESLARLLPPFARPADSTAHNGSAP